VLLCVVVRAVVGGGDGVVVLAGVGDGDDENEESSMNSMKPQNE